MTATQEGLLCAGTRRCWAPESWQEFPEGPGLRSRLPVLESPGCSFSAPEEGDVEGHRHLWKVLQKHADHTGVMGVSDGLCLIHSEELVGSPLT